MDIEIVLEMPGCGEASLTATHDEQTAFGEIAHAGDRLHWGQPGQVLRAPERERGMTPSTSPAMLQAGRIFPDVQIAVLSSVHRSLTPWDAQPLLLSPLCAARSPGKQVPDSISISLQHNLCRNERKIITKNYRNSYPVLLLLRITRNNIRGHGTNCRIWCLLTQFSWCRMASAASSTDAGSAPGLPSGLCLSSSSGKSSNSFNIRDWVICRSMLSGMGSGNAVVIDIDIHHVHDIEVRIPEQATSWPDCAAPGPRRAS